ncbi:MAG TPA: ketopantoate reductase family protein [Desulfosalsimonadaceae bacterium]|nr:ketopantoate reductase family protein [Desulfosalsimonadaceae bacterium]
MQPIREVAILGAGAMGAFFAGKFFDSGFATWLIARGSRLERLQNEGVVINEKPYTIPAISPESAAAPVDLIIVAVKNHHLPEAVKGLDNLVGDSTIIISVMNGLESEEYLGSMFGREKVLYAVSVGIDALREENRITYSKPGKHYFGEADNTRPGQKVMRVQQAFAEAAIPYETPRDMMRIMWWKFMINVGMNQASTVMGAPYGVFQTSRDARQLMEALMQEVIAVAKAGAIELTRNDLDEWNAVLQGLSPLGKTSMLQDMEAGRKTEVEVFGKKVVELGKQHDLPTPVNRTLLQIIRVLEQNRRQA